MKTDGILNLDVVDAAMNAVFGLPLRMMRESSPERMKRLSAEICKLNPAFGDRRAIDCARSINTMIDNGLTDSEIVHLLADRQNWPITARSSKRPPDFMAVLPETFGDAELAVFTVREQAYPATRETPEEPGGLMPERVLWRGLDVTASLTQDEMESIQEQLREQT